ncbi:MAG: AAA family ATPase [Candidatus Kerfeldbacteria bacterium RIFCSPHIGHO2_12_FULL_48_17]|uniref:AAA family ATPase n=1 Tax=Candidatus Kerfeldbacteria bacterium RIFCSPHIGHO2_12_FULL_48_17 TaxID=1798542 RepID=A0A1G2B1A4_9BACT|nr:MAG: AAA family ATPase [Candidatus Kerfeldbacteria bacterium RIFCSPHIGHO2_12_FULL_48_17]
MLIQRDIKQDILTKLRTSSKAVILYGARQIGKTTLCQDVIAEMKLKTLSINADELRYIDVLSSRDSRKLGDLVEGYDLLFIDEAQRVPNIGINLKILIDQFPRLHILVTGSSSFELANSVSEPLTGRKWVYQLYPIAQRELAKHYNRFELESQKEDRLIWGAYPEIFHIRGQQEKTEYLRTLASDYLYKDILALYDVRHADKIRNILRLLAFQIGQEVSLNELARQLEMSKETVARYIDLLEKTFVIYRVGGFSRNLRKEVSKLHKYYFYDLGVRNALIDNFKPLAERNDQGALWENFLIMERMKRNNYMKRNVTPYFWRTYGGSEVDYVEETGEGLWAFELKWNKRKAPVSKTWIKEYPDSIYEVIHEENWLDFVL